MGRAEITWAKLEMQVEIKEWEINLLSSTLEVGQWISNPTWLCQIMKVWILKWKLILVIDFDCKEFENECKKIVHEINEKFLDLGLDDGHESNQWQEMVVK